MPGSLTGASPEGEKYLESFGMLAVELMDDAGRKLQLASGNPATITLSLSNRLTAAAPPTIPLWYFDEDRGFWQQEGEAVKIGNTYVGKVGHFSFWNCDVPRDYISLSGRVKTPDGCLLSGARVILTSSLMGKGSVSSSSGGEFCGKVPAYEPFQLTIKYDEIEIPIAGTVGSFNSDVKLMDIIVDIPGLVKVTGTVETCSHTAVTDGRVMYGNNAFAEIVNGIYSFKYLENKLLRIKAYNRTDNKESGYVTFVPGVVQDTLEPIKACNKNIPTFSAGYYLDGVKVDCSHIFAWVHDTRILQLWSGINSDKNTISLLIFGYNGPGIYKLDQSDKRHIKLDGNAGHPIIGIEYEVEIFAFGTGTDEVMDLAFSGTCKKWDEQAGTYVAAKITDGWMRRN